MPPRRRPRNETEDYVPRRKLTGQRAVDSFSSMIHHVQTRLKPNQSPYAHHVPPHEYYARCIVPSFATTLCPATALCTQWVNTSFHPDTRATKARVTFTNLHWSSTGRRLLASTARGELLLYNGHSFGLELQTVAHEEGRAIRSLAWGATNDLIVSGDDHGSMKLWLPTLVLLGELQTNHRSVCEIGWAPTERKIVTCGADGSGRVWDLSTLSKGGHSAGEEDVRLEGHGGEVFTVDWHPFQALIATGSNDRDIRLWDPRTAARGSLATLSGHSQPVSCVRWHHGGQYILSGGKDCCAKLWDIRTMKEMVSFVGHSRDITRVQWHPTHHNLFVTAGLDGSVLYWLMNEARGAIRSDGVREVSHYFASMESAQDKFRDVPMGINDLAFSPTGNLLATCAMDVRYWHRNKPGAVEEADRGQEAMDSLI